MKRTKKQKKQFNYHIILITALLIGSSIIGFTGTRLEKEVEASIPPTITVRKLAKIDQSKGIAKKVEVVDLITNNPSVEVKIRQIAKEECSKQGFGHNCVKDLLGMALTEKRDLDCNGFGDGGMSWGCYQIHLGYHPQITKEQAKDLKFAIPWTLKRMVAYGYPKYRSNAIMRHNGTPGTDKTLAYLDTVNRFSK